ncbi:hypothetical protein [Verminephrobacter eiseniae]|uniref:hypothetical protein n=1 Tax=Verminephrobacter eiseniae TaxID=364317 RepID=UPI0022378CB4|nr:hypothetical protein [Verminephrobacter eiseniae]
MHEQTMRRKGLGFLLRAPAQVTGACPGRSAPAAPGGHFASGPLRMIWPFHPGASVDGVARPVAERISRKLDPSGGRGQRAGDQRRHRRASGRQRAAGRLHGILCHRFIEPSSYCNRIRMNV